ncbi:MAG TPA: helix-turn-helix domain-containing protein, partial [Candidatus Saccharimonadales bacterium]|nr:helix-turn-helix domain-containing protein [Candidatus Saccharimonadales bacterium]
LCALVDAIIGDADGLYHPGQFNDRLLLGLKGTMSEVELHLIRSRLNGGLWEAARRGELRKRLPVGFEHDSNGAIVMTPDEAIRDTIALVFSKFVELGSARQVVATLRDDSVLLPHRDQSRSRIFWGPATYPTVHHILTNPAYAGVYAYGRSKTQRRLDEQGVVKVKPVVLPLAEWPVLIEDHHPGFISFQTYRANLDRLQANWRSKHGEAGGAVRSGAALLQGLVRCGRCGRRMQVAYTGALGRKYRRYSCHQAHQMQAAEHACQALGGVHLERCVVDAFLEMLVPASLEATLATLQETEQAWTVECKQHALLVEQARFEAERAQRQFDLAEPENRLVARTLERQWEKCLSELALREQELARFRDSRPSPLTPEEVEWLRTAGADLAGVWEAESTTNRERKQLLRCVIADLVVTVRREQHVAEVTIVWAGGATSQLTSRVNRVGESHATPEAVLEMVRQLAPRFTNDQIARIFNSQHLHTGRGQTFNRIRVAYLRERLGIPSPTADMTETDDPNWVDVPTAAGQLDVSPDTIRRWAREGFLDARQLIPGAPWSIHITDQIRQQVVAEAPPGWVGLADAARYLGHSKQTVLDWIRSGKLPAVQVMTGKRKGLRIEVGQELPPLFVEAVE